MGAIVFADPEEVFVNLIKSCETHNYITCFKLRIYGIYSGMGHLNSFSYLYAYHGGADHAAYLTRKRLETIF
jgi:hypothetical protein